MLPGRSVSLGKGTTMQRKPAIMFRAPELEPAIQLRGENANEIAKRDLARYYRLLEQELGAIMLIPAEWRLLREAIRTGHLLDNPTQADILASLDHASSKESADNAPISELACKLDPLTPGRVAALLDYAERWQ